MADDKVVIYALGDRQIVQHMRFDTFKKEFDPVLPVIRDGDIRYCQLECMFSDRPKPTFVAPPGLCMSPKLVDRLTYLNINMTSPDGNHNMEYGTDAVIDTIDTLDKAGIKHCGAGINIEEARKPAVFNIKGNKIAFLGYNSAMLLGDQAGPNRPGVAPMRIDTFYQTVEYNQPGSPPRIRTYAWQDDLKAMQEDVRKAKATNDVVIMTYHAGVHFVRAEMADYQFEVCHAAIDAGADMIIGTHPHVLKAIEVYKGKMIFHSLGNFGFDKPRDPKTGELRETGMSPNRKEQIKRYRIRVDDPAKTENIFGSRMDEGQQTGVVKIIVADKKIQRASFLPVMFDQEEGPMRILHAGNKEFDQVVKYQMDVTKEVELDTKFKLEGDELVIVP